MPEGELRGAGTITDFLFGGRAVFTVQSRRTQKHHTYRVIRVPDDGKAGTPLRWWVSLMTGSDNSDPKSFTYIGMIAGRNGGFPRFVLTAKSPMPLTAAPVAGFKYVLDAVVLGDITRMARFHFFHEGRCAVCNRPLTDPVSIQRGIGPVCLQEVTRA